MHRRSHRCSIPRRFIRPGRSAAPLRLSAAPLRRSLGSPIDGTIDGAIGGPIDGAIGGPIDCAIGATRCGSLRLAAARCGSLRLAAARCHFGQAFARVLRGRAPLAPSPRDKRLSELPRRCMGASAVAGMYFDCSHVSDCCPDTVHSWNDPAPCRVGSRPLGCIGRLGCIGGPSAVPSAVSIPRRFISPGLSAAPLRQSHRRHHRRCIRWSLAAPSLVGRSRRRP